jgi:protein tyrosine/serine phosphatase
MELQKISLFRDNRILFKHLAATLAALSLICSLIPAAAAASDRKKDKDRSEVEGCDVKNFGRVNEHIYRGGQPDDDEYAELAALGIKTVIDLREDPERYARRAAEAAGLHYVNLRLNAKRPPTAEESKLFLSWVNEQTNWPVFVHCAGGRHRTGVLLAVYRMEMDGWNADRAYREMKDFKFYSNWGHGEMKDYVFDYYRRMNDRNAQLAPAARARRVSTSDQND